MLHLRSFDYDVCFSLQLIGLEACDVMLFNTEKKFHWTKDFLGCQMSHNVFFHYANKHLKNSRVRGLVGKKLMLSMLLFKK